MYCNNTAVRRPQVADRLIKKPYFGIDNLTDPIPCTAVYANEAYGFYTVQFDAGYSQSYKFGG